MSVNVYPMQINMCSANFLILEFKDMDIILDLINAKNM